MSPQMSVVTEESNTISYLFWTLRYPTSTFHWLIIIQIRGWLKKITHEFICKLGLCEMMFLHSWRALLLIVFPRLVLKWAYISWYAPINATENWPGSVLRGRRNWVWDYHLYSICQTKSLWLVCGLFGKSFSWHHFLYCQLDNIPGRRQLVFTHAETCIAHIVMAFDSNIQIRLSYIPLFLFYQFS